MSDTPFQPPQIVNSQVDEESQMQRYLAEIAMEDIRLLPDTQRGDRTGTLARYKAGQPAREASPDNAELTDEEYAKVDMDRRRV